MPPRSTHKTAERATRAARPRLAGGDARRYAGRWIALRDGKVVAASRSRRLVARHESVRDTDVIYKVPSSDTLIV